MPELSLPTAALMSGVKSWWERKFVLPVYVESHKHYDERDGFFRQWHAVGGDLSVSLHLPMALQQGRSPCAYIAVRNDSEQNQTTEAGFLIEAEAGSAVFQQAITVHRLCKKPRIVALPSIPLRGVHVAMDRQHIPSFTQLRVWVTSSNGVALTDWSTGHPGYSTWVSGLDYVNERFEEKWGAYWNCGAIDRALERKRNWLTYHLATQKVYRASRGQHTWIELAKGVWRAILGKPLCRLLTLPWLLQMYFWLPIILRQGKLVPTDLGEA